MFFPQVKIGAQTPNNILLYHTARMWQCVCARSLKPCPTPCNPVDCGLPGSSVHGILPSKNTGVGCHAFLQGVFWIQGSNPHVLNFLHWQVGSLPLAPPGKHRMWQSPYLNPCSPASVLCIMTQLGMPFSSVNLKIFLSWALSQDLLSQGKGVSQNHLWDTSTRMPLSPGS